MYNIKSITKAFAIAAAAALGFTACQDDFDTPNLPVPVATIEANITIADLKAEFWQEETNYATTIAPREDGSHYIIKGRVVSSDEAGNVFKSLVLDDGTAALPFSINRYNLYLDYRRGQEVVVDLTGMDIGKYNGYMQVGLKEFYEAGNAWEVSFMAPETFTRGAQLNGLPDLALVDTLQINSFDQLPATPAGLQQYQGRLVRFNNVEWQNAGVETYSTYHSSGVSQNIVDANGATLAARTSGYSNFWNLTLPEGRGDVVCILGYYGSAWQLTLLDAESSMNFGNPTVQPGAEGNPYSVAEAVQVQAAGTAPAGAVWVQGYIVGTVAPEVETVTGNADIEWGSDPFLANTVVIASDPSTTNVAECLVMALPEGSAMREYVNIKAHPENVGKLLAVRGRLAAYMGTFGVTGNNGTSSEFKLEGVEVGGAVPAGDGSQESPYNTTQVINAGPTSTTESPAGFAGVWVKGYIVGSMPADGTYIDKTIFGAAAELKTNIVIAPTADCTDASKCIGLQLPNNAIRAALNLQDNPGVLGKAVAVKGDVMKYCGGPGVKNLTDYVLEGTTVTPTPDPTPGNPTGDGTEASPYNVAKALEVTNALASGAQSESDVYVKGIISKISEIDTGSYGNATYEIVDAEGGTAFKIFRGYWLNGDKFTSSNQLAVGAEVVVLGKLLNYMGNTPEMAQGNKIVSYNGQSTVEPTPDPTPDVPVGDAVTIAAGNFPHGADASATGDVSGALTESGYTLTTDKASGATAPAVNVYNGVGTLRLYANNTLNIKGATMGKIVFTLNTSTGARRYTTFAPSTGTVATQATGDATITWNGNTGDVTFTVGALGTYGTESTKPGQIHISSIEIYPAAE